MDQATRDYLRAIAKKGGSSKSAAKKKGAARNARKATRARWGHTKEGK